MRRWFLMICVPSTVLVATVTAQTAPLAWVPLSQVSGLSTLRSLVTRTADARSFA